MPTAFCPLYIVNLSTHHTVAKLLGRHASGLLERDTETVRALIAAHRGEHFHLVVGFREQTFGALDSHALKFLARVRPTLS